MAIYQQKYNDEWIHTDMTVSFKIIVQTYTTSSNATYKIVWKEDIDYVKMKVKFNLKSQRRFSRADPYNFIEGGFTKNLTFNSIKAGEEVILGQWKPVDWDENIGFGTRYGGSLDVTIYDDIGDDHIYLTGASAIALPLVYVRVPPIVKQHIETWVNFLGARTTLQHWNIPVELGGSDSYTHGIQNGRVTKTTSDEKMTAGDIRRYSGDWFTITDKKEDSRDNANGDHRGNSNTSVYRGIAVYHPYASPQSIYDKSTSFFSNYFKTKAWSPDHSGNIELLELGDFTDFPMVAETDWQVLT